MSESTPLTEQIKSIRARADMSVREMAKRMDMSPSGYSHYENPRRFKETFLPMKVAMAMVEATRETDVAAEDILALVGSQPTQDGSNRSGQGFSEDAIAFSFQAKPANPDDPNHLLRAVFGARASTPATFRILHSLPAFALVTGDVLLCDMSRAPFPGELALVSIMDDEHGSSSTTIRRFAPPFLLDGEFLSSEPLRIDAPGVIVRYPIVGTIRGIADQD